MRPSGNAGTGQREAIARRYVADVGLAGSALNPGEIASVLVLRTNAPARRLYERLGLRVVGEEPNRYRMST